MRAILLALIKGYRLVISPMLPPTCRFHPTCSAYAVEALEKHGLLRGSWLAVRRIGRCHPFCEGGVDPVPEPKNACGCRAVSRETDPASGDESHSHVVQSRD
jgi:putative membrane protein insertion efficiency factor